MVPITNFVLMKSIKPNNQNHIILIFDGECLFCNAFFRFLLKRDKRKIIKYATFQSTFAQELINTHFRNVEVPDTVLLWQNEKLYIKSEAALRSITCLRGAWSLAKVLLYVPTVIRNWLYDYIARNRYKWFSKGKCVIPENNWPDRFIS